LSKLNESEVREKNQIEFTKGFAALENLNVDENVDRTWEIIKQTIETSAKVSLCLHEFK